MRLVLLGPPGAGKGTQAILIANRFSVPHISTGEMLRAAVSAGDQIGKQVSSLLDKGQLVPDGLMIDIIRRRLAGDDCASGFVLDGFPRTVEQARVLDLLLLELRMPLTKVVELQVPDPVLIERLRLRGKESGRSDDKVEVTAKRLEVYWTQTKPVSAFYREQSALVEVDGIGTVSEVQERIVSRLA